MLLMVYKTVRLYTRQSPLCLIYLQFLCVFLPVQHVCMVSHREKSPEIIEFYYSAKNYCQISLHWGSPGYSTGASELDRSDWSRRQIWMRWLYQRRLSRG